MIDATEVNFYVKSNWCGAAGLRMTSLKSLQGEKTDMKLKICVALAMLLTLKAGIAEALAQDVDCDDPQNTNESRFCASQEFEAADKRLNKAYRALTKRLEAEPLEILKQSQRAWIGFRDSECEFQAYWTKGGTASPGVGTQCMAVVTKARVKQLEAYLNCEEGDMTCPPAD